MTEPVPCLLTVTPYVRTAWGRILLVDDEPDLLEVVAETLNALGHIVDTAGSGEEALRLRSSQRFDLRLSDATTSA